MDLVGRTGIEYTIISRADRFALMSDVNSYLKEGWELYEGVVFGEGIWIQAMIKRKDEKE